MQLKSWKRQCFQSGRVDWHVNFKKVTFKMCIPLFLKSLFLVIISYSSRNIQVWHVVFFKYCSTETISISQTKQHVFSSVGLQFKMTGVAENISEVRHWDLQSCECFILLGKSCSAVSEMCSLLCLPSFLPPSSLLSLLSVTLMLEAG